jgi:hypothetical protein
MLERQRGNIPDLSPMPTTTTHQITIAPALDRRGERLVGHFAARIDHGERLVRASATPFRDSARVLLERGLAAPNDVITMRHAGSRHEVLKAAVGKAAKLAAGASNAAGSCPGSGRASTHG